MIHMRESGVYKRVETLESMQTSWGEFFSFFALLKELVSDVQFQAHPHHVQGHQ